MHKREIYTHTYHSLHEEHLNPYTIKSLKISAVHRKERHNVKYAAIVWNSISTILYTICDWILENRP